jgi:hypothetical protein
VTRHHSCRVSPFGHPRIHARLTTPRGISQPPTSFIGSQCQGIHHAPLNTYNTKPKNESPTHTPKRAHAGIRKIAHQTPKSPHHPTGRHEHNRCLDARNHYPQIKHHTPPPKMERQQPNFLVGSRPQHCKVITTPGFPPSGRRGDGLVVSKPNSVSGSPSPENSQRIPFRLNVCRAPEPHPLQVRPIHRIAQITEPPHDVGGPESRGAP